MALPTTRACKIYINKKAAGKISRLELIEKVALGHFFEFLQGLRAAIRPHWPLDRCKKPRTGRGFLQIDEG